MTLPRRTSIWDVRADPETQAGLDRLGADIRRLRARTGLSQRALGTTVQVHQSTISRIERGLTLSTPISTIARIMMALDGHFARMPAGFELLAPFWRDA